ncbi:MAG: hypothetical protein NTV56_00760 [Alphaproteobacteria bacterium]|nr:hypothetical protein [Alphaproteobacteria bacterium]
MSVPANSKRGQQRKSRRVRLPIAVGGGRDREFTPQESDWQRIEQEYGCQLSAEARAEIAGIVERYFLWQPGEAMAPFADDARRYLDQIQKSADQFWRVLLERSHTPMTGSGDDAHIAEKDSIRGVGVGYVQSHLGRFIKQFGSGPDWRGLLNVMQATMPAIMATRQYLDEQTKLGFVEGRAWDELVWRLSELAKQHGLPNGVAKSDDPTKASPFVALVRELQLTFPDSFRRHGASNAALAEAITVARREIRKSLAWRAAQKANSPSGQN